MQAITKGDDDLVGAFTLLATTCGNVFGQALTSGLTKTFAKLDTAKAVRLRLCRTLKEGLNERIAPQSGGVAEMSEEMAS